jgi:AraC-like DNA-binding protein
MIETAAMRATFDINVTSVERVIRRSPLVGIGEFRCPTDHPQFVGGGPQTCPYVVFPRSSVRIQPEHSRSEVCTPNVVSLYNIGDAYARQAISVEGDLSDWIAISPDLLRDIAEPYVDDRAAQSERIFARPVAPIAPRIYLTQRAFFTAAQESEKFSLLAVEEGAIGLVDRVLAAANGFWGHQQRCVKRAHGANERRQLTIADEAKAVMALHYTEAVSVMQIARHVHCSPGTLCRTFKRITGFTLHGYQQQLRLRASLQLLADSWMDFAGIAEHLGFATHSHFTDVFRRQFGITPTQFTQRRSLALFADCDDRIRTALENSSNATTAAA